MVATWALANKASLQGFGMDDALIRSQESRWCKVSYISATPRRRFTSRVGVVSFTTTKLPFTRSSEKREKKINLARKTVQSITFPVSVL